MTSLETHTDNAMWTWTQTRTHRHGHTAKDTPSPTLQLQTTSSVTVLYDGLSSTSVIPKKVVHLYLGLVMSHKKNTHTIMRKTLRSASVPLTSRAVYLHFKVSKSAMTVSVQENNRNVCQKSAHCFILYTLKSVHYNHHVYLHFKGNTQTNIDRSHSGPQTRN